MLLVGGEQRANGLLERVGLCFIPTSHNLLSQLKQLNRR
jgi:hypothetical protein